MKLTRTSVFTPLCALAFASAVYTQTTHTVTVGKQGSFFDPATISAGINDTVVFQFIGLVHTVTQGSFASPCLALPGGFNSGVAGPGIGVPAGIQPTWSLKITNDSEPLWFFCQISTPTSHCASGMVGVINPPSQAMYNQYLAAAKAVSGTPSPMVSLALTGSGAVATGPPSAPPSSALTSSAPPTSAPSSSAPLSSSPPTPTSSTTATTTSAAAGGTGTKSHLGAIIGGVIGGLIGGLLILGALIWWLRHRKAKARRESASTDDSRFFRYRVPVRTPSDAFREAKANENSTFSHSNDTPPMRNANLASRDSSPDIARPLSPVRRGQFEPLNFVMPTTATSAVNPPTTTDNAPTANAGATPSGAQVSNNNIDMQTLANEVAQVLMRSTSGNTLNAQRRAAMEDPEGNYLQPQSMHVNNPSAADGQGLLDPPAYRQQAGVNSPATQKSRLPRD